jgi:hypothetical protein
MSTDTIPITIHPDAEAFVAELGLQGPFRRMVEHMRHHVPELRSIEVTLAEPYDLGGGPRVIIEALRSYPGKEYDPTHRQLIRWQVDTFPPEVFQHFCLDVSYEPPDAR